jgi:DnaJ-class molecular chaperone
MENYYKTLGVSSAATTDELRRAYRILARRYHPDVNPGKASEETFKRIAVAYAVLQDPEKRRAFDSELAAKGADQEEFSSAFERAHHAYRKQQAFERASERVRERVQRERSSKGPEESKATKGATSSTTAAPRPPSAKAQASGVLHDLKKILTYSQGFASGIKGRFSLRKPTEKEAPLGEQVSQVSILEISITVSEAIRGVKRTVELSEGASTKKISVALPPGVRSGSVVRFRRKERTSEEIVLIVKVAAHPFLSVTPRGLVMEVPLSVSEAISGARIQVPTLEDPATVVVAPGSQSGHEVRLRGQGINHRDGTRGDLFIRFIVRLPDIPGAVGLKEKVSELDPYYATPVRAHLPPSILEM